MQYVIRQTNICQTKKGKVESVGHDEAFINLQSFPSKSCPDGTSPFSVVKSIWIVTKFGELKSATLVRGASRIRFSKHIPRI